VRKEILQIDKIDGPLIILSNIDGVSYGEIIDILVDDKTLRKGKVVRIEKDKVVPKFLEELQAFPQEMSGLDLQVILLKSLCPKKF